MAGVVFDLNDAIKLKPSVLLKYVKDAPFDADIHASLIFYDTFWAGATYRLGGIGNSFGAVSYTHLTLPTILRV